MARAYIQYSLQSTQVFTQMYTHISRKSPGRASRELKDFFWKLVILQEDWDSNSVYHILIFRLHCKHARHPTKPNQSKRSLHDFKGELTIIITATTAFAIEKIKNQKNKYV